MHVEHGKILTFCPFSNILMTSTALYTNEIKFLSQRYKQDLVLNTIVIAFTAKHLIKFLLILTD